MYQGGARSSVRNKPGRGAPLPLLTPIVHSNFKLNMAGRINDRELITLARISKTPEENRWGWFRGFKMERGGGGGGRGGIGRLGRNLTFIGGE